MRAQPTAGVDAAALPLQAFSWRRLVDPSVPVLAASMVLAYGVMVVALALLMLQPTGRGGLYAVLMPPWADPDRVEAAAASAQGRVVARNLRAGMALVLSLRSDAPEALYRSGAWLVLDAEGLDAQGLGPQGLGGLCLSASGRFSGR